PWSYHVARACTLAPHAVADMSLPGRLAEKELQASREFWSLTEQGALACRAGRFQEAVPLFEQSLRADPKPGAAVVNWLWLAASRDGEMVDVPASPVRQPPHQRLPRSAATSAWLAQMLGGSSSRSFAQRTSQK